MWPMTRRIGSRRGLGNDNRSMSMMSMIFEATTGKRQGQNDKCDDRYEPFHFNSPFCILLTSSNAFLLI